MDTAHIGRRTVSGFVDCDDAHIIGDTRRQPPDPPTQHFLSRRRYVKMLRNGRRIPHAGGCLPLDLVADAQRGAVVPHLGSDPTHARTPAVDAPCLQIERRTQHLRRPVCPRILHNPQLVLFARCPGDVQFVEVQAVPSPLVATAEFGFVERQLRLQRGAALVGADVQRPIEIVLVGHLPIAHRVSRAQVAQPKER